MRKIQFVPATSEAIEAMGVICNIQGMRAIIHKDNYDPIKDFQQLQNMDLESLRELQDTTISIYNETLKK